MLPPQFRHSTLCFGRLYPDTSGDSDRSKFILISEISEAGKIACWLSTLAALTEYICSVPSIYNMAYNHP